MRRLLAALLFAALLFAALAALSFPVEAQVSGVRVVSSCGSMAPYGSLSPSIGSPAWLTVDANGNLCSGVTVSATASIAGFTPTPAYAQLTVGASSARVALPTGTSVVVYNIGANAAYVQLGGSGVTATTANDVIQPNSWLAFTPSAGQTYIAAIETAGATALNISGGAGLPSGAGGGGGGGSSSNASVSATGGGLPSYATYLGVNVAGTFTGLAATANGLKVDGSAVTQPISAASLPLPTGAMPSSGGTVGISGTLPSFTSTQTVNLGTIAGAATSALQTTGNTTLTTINTTLGTPMQNSGGSVTANAGTNLNTANIESYTSRLLSGAAPVAPGAASATTAQVIGGTYNSSGVTLTGGQQSGIQLDAAGRLIVDVGAGGGSGGTSSSYGSAFPATGTAAGAEYLSSAPTLTTGQMVALQTDVNGNLKTNVVTGSITANAGTNLNTSALGTAANQSTIITNLGTLHSDLTTLNTTAGNPLAAGTNNIGSIDVLGHAGATMDGVIGAATAPTNGLAVLGVYNSVAPTPTTGQSTALQLDSAGRLIVDVGAGGGSGGTSSSFGAAFPATGTAAGGEYLSSPPTLTTGQMVALQTDVNGNVKVNIAAGGGTGGTALTDNTAFTQGSAGGTSETPISCLYKSSYTAATSGNSTVVQCNSSGALLINPFNSANFGVGAVTGGVISFANAMGINVNASLKNVTGVTPGVAQSGTIFAENIDQTSVGGNAIATAASGVAKVGIVGNAGGTLDTAPGTGAATMLGVQGATSMVPLASNITQVGGATQSATNPLPVAPVAISGGGTSTCTPDPAVPATPAGVNCKASAGTVFTVHIGNIGAAAAWLKLYDSATAPTCGSGTPKVRYLIPANSTAALGAGSNLEWPVGAAFTSGIGYCVTGALADADTTAVAANSITVSIGYK
jgi:hypothetical protein